CLVSSPCARDAICTVTRHVAQCDCPRGTSLISSQIACEKIDVNVGGCQTDADCPSQLACINSQCQNPCSVLKPCGSNAECRVLDYVPWRAMICLCPTGYAGDANRGCVKVEKPGCSSDYECPYDKDCIRGECKN